MAAACTATGSLVSFFAITRDDGGGGGEGQQGSGDGSGGGARLEHLAMIQCRTGRETMANCVRFGRFDGKASGRGACAAGLLGPREHHAGRRARLAGLGR
jgi:hypothetical protein